MGNTRKAYLDWQKNTKSGKLDKLVKQMKKTGKNLQSRMK